MNTADINPDYQMAPVAEGEEPLRERASASVRRRMTAFALWLLVPLLGLVGALGWHLVGQEGARRSASVVADAAGVAATVDRDIAGMRATLAALGSSPSLRAGDLAAFHAQAAAVAERAGFRVVLRSRDGRNLLHSSVPYGATLPPAAALGVEGVALASGKGGVSGLVLGSVVREPSFGAVEPVRLAGGEPALLIAGASAHRVRDLLERAGLPAGSSAAVADARGVVVARSPDHDGAVGRPLAEWLRQEAPGDASLAWHAEAAAGAFAARLPDGEAALVGGAEVAGAGWRVVVATPGVNGPVARAVLPAAGLAAGLLALAAWMAARVGAGIVVPLRALEASALALSAGRTPPTRVPGGLREADRVALALHNAGAALRRADEERSAALATVIAEVGRDYDQALSAVVSHLDPVRRDTAPGSAGRRHADQAMEGARRAAALTSRLVEFGAPQGAPGADRAVDLGELLTGMADPLRRALGAGVEVRVEAAPDLLVGAMPAEVEVALIAFAERAREAMPFGGRFGARLVARGVGERADDVADPPVGLTRGDYACLTVVHGGSAAASLLRAGAEPAGARAAPAPCPLRALAARCGGTARAVPGGVELWLPRLRRAYREGFVFALASEDVAPPAPREAPRARPLATDRAPALDDGRGRAEAEPEVRGPEPRALEARAPEAPAPEVRAKASRAPREGARARPAAAIAPGPVAPRGVDDMVT